MKPTFVILVLCSVIIGRSLLASDPIDPSPASRLLPPTKASVTTSSPAEELLKILPATAAAKTPDASSQVSAKQDACCAAKPAAKIEEKGCCAHETTAGKTAGAPAACPHHESIVNPKSEIVNYSSSSLYQLDTAFTTDSGQPFALGSLQGRPVVLTMFFASCTYACPLIVADMSAIRAKLPADLRDRAALVLVTFDGVRDTPAALATFRAQRGLDAQWILLHGNNDAVRELAALLGVKFKQEADGAFAHSNLITLLNPAGEIIHQRTGLKDGLDEAAAALAAAR